MITEIIIYYENNKVNIDLKSTLKQKAKQNT